MAASTASVKNNEEDEQEDRPRHEGRAGRGGGWWKLGGSLRRTYENLLREAGVDQLVRRSLAGWRTEEAQSIYANVAPTERRAAANSLVNLVRPPDVSPFARIA